MPSTGRSVSLRPDRLDYLRSVIQPGPDTPTSTTRTLFSMQHLSALIAVAVLISGCGPDSTGESRVAEAVMPSVVENAPSIVGSDQARADFVMTAGGDWALAGLSDSELDCVVEKLLVVLEPAEVVALNASEPTSAQAPVVVAALRSCELVLKVARLGLAGGSVGDSGIPSMDPACVLEGVTEDDMTPVLEVLFAGTGRGETDRAVEVLLSETPVMGNLVRCGLEGLLGEADGEVPLFCRGLFDQVATMMTVVVEHGMAAEVGIVDPVLLAELFSLSDKVFVWLADNVPDGQRADAKTVSDASVKVSKVMAEALYGLDDSSDPEFVLGAVFGALARLDAELAGDSVELELARARLEVYVTSTCGDSVVGLFHVLSGAGSLSGV